MEDCRLKGKRCESEKGGFMGNGQLQVGRQPFSALQCFVAQVEPSMLEGAKFINSIATDLLSSFD